MYRHALRLLRYRIINIPADCNNYLTLVIHINLQIKVPLPWRYQYISQIVRIHCLVIYNLQFYSRLLLMTELYSLVRELECTRISKTSVVK